jgi:aldose 1-epimerase
MGRFTLDGVSYTLAINNNPRDALQPAWRPEGVRQGDLVRDPAGGLSGDSALELRYHSAAGEEGYPGNLDITVTYRLTEANELRIDYSAVSDKATPGQSHQPLLLQPQRRRRGRCPRAAADDHGEPLRRSSIPGMIPTGECVRSRARRFDFTTPHTLGERIGANDEQLKLGNGYDHCWVFDHHGPELELAARAHDPVSGRTLEVMTTEPGVQLYTG